MKEPIQPDYKKRLSAAWDRIKAMDKADKKAGLRPPISVAHFINVAFAALDSGNKEAMDDAIGYAVNAGIANAVASFLEKEQKRNLTDKN